MILSSLLNGPLPNVFNEKQKQLLTLKGNNHGTFKSSIVRGRRKKNKKYLSQDTWQLS